MNKLPKSAYVHIPFCHRRCFYCDFPVIPLGDRIDSQNGNGSNSIKDYLFYLKKEILSIKHKSSLSTLYIGGGTPSILNYLQIKELVNIFRNSYGFDDGAEITMEVDPASFEEKDLYGFIDAGINRFSLGAQSFNDEILKEAGRRHNNKNIKEACSWLNKAISNSKINSWSIDLIQNLPKSDPIYWERDLKEALKYKPPHISIYDLSIEEGTVFKKINDSGKLNLPNHEKVFRNSMITNLLLRELGYSRYEISNYSLPGHQSRHNRVYWRGFGWWGFGQGSTSAPWGLKLTRPRISKQYKKWVLNQCEQGLDDSLMNYSYKYLDLDEKIMLGMRVKEGINIKLLFEEQGWDKEKLEINFKKLLKRWEQHIQNRLVCNDGDRYFLSDPKGMDLSNTVLVSMFQWWEEIN